MSSTYSLSYKLSPMDHFQTQTPYKDTSVCLLMPGLGLPPSIFKEMELSCSAIINLEWIEPKYNEDLTSYCNRLLQTIPLHKYDSISIVGHSFGGMIAQQIAHDYSIDQLILISTIMSDTEKPSRIKSIRNLPNIIMRNIKRLIQLSFPVWARQHGYTNQYLRQQFKRSVNTLSPYYFEWSLRQIQAWNELPIECSIFRAHGYLDKTFPISLVHATHLQIKNGDHMMVYSHGKELSKEINNFIKSSRLKA